MMWNCWAGIIRGRWFRPAGGAVIASLCAAALSVSLSAQSFDALADRYRKSPTPAARSAVLRYARAHPAIANGALALLLLGVMENDARQYGDALTHLKAAEKRLPELADYIGILQRHG